MEIRLVNHGNKKDDETIVYFFNGYEIIRKNKRELQYGGMAKNYEVYGINTLTLTWTAGQTIGNGVVISNEN